jgi:hypothetical protein
MVFWKGNLMRRALYSSGGRVLERELPSLQSAVVAAAEAFDEVLRDLEKEMSPAHSVGRIEEGYYPGLGGE